MKLHLLAFLIGWVSGTPEHKANQGGGSEPASCFFLSGRLRSLYKLHLHLLGCFLCGKRRSHIPPLANSNANMLTLKLPFPAGFLLTGTFYFTL